MAIQRRRRRGTRSRGKRSRILHGAVRSGASAQLRTPGGFCVELGPVRIYAKSAEGMQEVLEPLLQVASQKNLAEMLGVSTRTLYRWQRAGRVPTPGNHMLAQIVGGMGARTDVGSRESTA